MNPNALPFYPSGTPGRVSPALYLLHGSDSEPESRTFRPSSAPFPGPITGIGQNLNQIGQENAQFSLKIPRDSNKNSLQAFREVSPRASSHQATMNYINTSTTPRSPQETRTSATATLLRQQNEFFFHRFTLETLELTRLYPRVAPAPFRLAHSTGSQTTPL